MDNYGSRSFIYESNMIATPVLPYLHYDIWGLTALILYGLAERYQYYCAGRKGVK
jgi:MutT/NUDIX family protein